MIAQLRLVPRFALQIQLILTTLLLASGNLMAEPIGLMEKYALAADREAMLAELIPGSEDYYFYHCLHFQTVGQLERSEALIKDWLAEHKGRETTVIRGMLDRQRLLTYTESPERTIDYLVNRLGIQLNHAPPVVKGERRFPSELNAAELVVDKLAKDALNRNDSLKPSGLGYLAELYRSGNTAGLRINLHEFLKRIDGPYIKGLDELVMKELADRNDKDKRFGDLRAHSYLTLAELDRVAKAIPAVADDTAFVSARLRRLRPDGDSDPSQQPAVRLDYLRRVEAYARTLPASHNSLKACATYRLLEANLNAGIDDRELFVRYLKLPRNSPIVHVVWARRPIPKANLGQDFMDMALLSPVGDEHDLVRTYLERFLRNANDTSEFAQYLNPEFLSRVFAETKLMAGIGNDEQWYKMLNASQRQSIRDLVVLELSPENKIRFADAEPTTLVVDVKNLKELVVRIYQINTLSYYRTHKKPVNTDIDLDGLIATHEKKLTFNEPAVQRHREIVSLQEISGRGVWIVDLVGKGVRARAMIRRGEIHHVDSIVADGMLFTIVDENNEPIDSATMIVGAHELVADDKGQIGLPPLTKAVDRTAIISDGMIATQVKFKQLKESYRLDAGMHIDRTQLQSGGNGKLTIRPRVSMSGQIIAPSTLSDVSLLIQSNDLDGLATTIQLNNLELDQNQELVIPFRVPPRLSALNVTLSAKVDGIADGRRQSLQTNRSWDIAGVRRTSYTHDVFLTRDADQYVIEVRGRTGEPVAGATVSVSMRTEVRNAPVEQTLQSDDQGRIRLGTLPGVSHLHYRIPSGMAHERDLSLDRVVWPSEVHTTTENGVRLPLATELDDAQKHYRLLEVRGGNYHLDQSDQLAVQDGLLSIQPLAAGDYHLVDLQTAAQTQIIVVEGRVHGFVAAGRVRHRSISPNQPIGIASIDRGDNGVRIRLSGDTSNARVHVYASRYLDATDPLSQLGLPLPGLSGRSVALPRCGYISGLRLGDEYQYVLRRRYAAKFPGVMLPQPSVILNPWETEKTTNTSQTAAKGDAPAAAPMSDVDAELRAALQTADSQAQVESSDFDFLADPGVVVSNLIANEDGVVTIPADVVKDMPLLQIIVCDPATLLQRTLAAPLREAETVDLRLKKSLDAEKALSFERAVSVVSADKPLDLKTLGSAQLQVYGSVAALFKLYKTLVDDPRLNEFDDLAYWHTFDQNTKLKAYSRLASHELHVFLWSHDREFFDDVVRPYLANKKEKQFIDHWLLGHDLSGFTRLWQYSQLNAAERALLAMRLPDVREAIRRELNEVVAQQDINHQQNRKQIEHALATSGLAFFDDEFLVDEEQELEAFGFEPSKGLKRSLGRNSGIDGLKSRLDASGGEALGKSSQLGLRSQRGRQAESKSRSVQKKKQANRGAAVYGGRGFAGGGFGFAGKAYAMYQELDATKQWAECNWDLVRTVGGAAPNSLVSVNPFWADLANGDPDSVRLSTNLLRPVDTRHSVLMAIALCGLPLKSGDIGLPTEDDQTYAPQHPVAVVTKRLKELLPAAGDSSILVGQRFTSLDQSTRRSKEAPEELKEFLTGVAYRGQTVISNPTSQQKLVDVFWQIPLGSLPLAGSQFTDSKTMTLEPFAVQAIEYQFYFPQPGQFQHYPATIASEGKLLSRGSEKTFSVVVEETEDNRVTWEKIARAGSPEQIKSFLDDANLREIDWMLIAHRMQDEDVYQTVISVLGESNLPITDLWAYSLKHRDEPAMKEYLSMQAQLVGRVGPVLDSPLLNVEPIERRQHELLEYAPLVRARIHRLGAENEILNSTFLGQYQSFVEVLGFRKDIPANEQLVLTYYLLLQNRIEESIAAFAAIDRDNVSTKLQFDYMSAYLALHREAYDEAGRIASQYADHPIPRWNSRFAEVARQLEQRSGLMQTQRLVSVDKDKTADNNQAVAEGSGDLAVIDRERRQAAATDEQPEVIVRVEGDTLRIDHRRSDEATLNLYGVDLELLFSKAPFVREDLQRMAMVKPTWSDTIEFDEPTGVANFQLDDDLKRQTLLVEIVAGASRSTALYYGGEITTYVSESYGQLQTTDAKTHKPISTAYVKVYARYPDGSVKFYKDGYTDARGRFDYNSISANGARGASRFAILVMSDEKGATLHDVATPNQ